MTPAPKVATTTTTATAEAPATTSNAPPTALPPDFSHEIIYTQRLGGVTSSEIALQHGVSVEAVDAIVARRVAEARTRVSAPDEALALGIDRCDAMLRALWAQAMAGDTAAIDRVLKIEERRDKLFGLNREDRRLQAFENLDENVLADLTPEQLAVLAEVQLKMVGRAAIGHAKSRGGRPKAGSTRGGQGVP